MPIIEANTDFMLGPEIDRDHRELIDFLNAAFDEFAASDHIEDIESVIKVLQDHATRNFVREERLMRETSYPGLAEHKKEHEMFTDTVIKFKGSRQPNTALTVEILWFLTDWATRHMQGTDAELGKYIHANANQ
jgi:hemerythrin-like metal-binding protein